MKKISVIICCYNAENLLQPAMESVLCQSIGLENLQIICVDDVSTDHTLTLLKQYEILYPNNITIVENTINMRLGNARNIAMKYVDTPYITFLDADDYLEPDALEKMYNIASSDTYDIVMSRFIIDSNRPSLPLDHAPISERETGVPSKSMIVTNDDSRRLFYFLNPLYGYACAKLIRTDFVFQNNLFFPPNVAYEDQLWGSLVHAYAQRVYILEEGLYHYYKNPNSIVHQKNSYQVIDLLTVHRLIRDTLIERELANLLAEEFDFLLIFNCYLAFIKMLVYQFEQPDYSLYLLAREYINAMLFDDYHNNKYISDGALTEIQALLLTTLDQALTKDEFKLLVNSIKVGSLLD